MKTKLKFEKARKIYQKFRHIPDPLLSRLGAGAFTVARVAPLKALAFDVPCITETTKMFEKKHPAVSKIAELGTYYTVGFTFVEYANEFARYLDAQKISHPYENAYTAVFSVPIVFNVAQAISKSLKGTAGKLSKIPRRITTAARKISEKRGFVAYSLIDSVFDIPITWSFIWLINKVAGDSVEQISGLHAMTALGVATAFAIVVSYGGLILAQTPLARKDIPKGHFTDFVQGFKETFCSFHLWRNVKSLLADMGIIKTEYKEKRFEVPVPLTSMQHAGQLVALLESYFIYVQAIRLVTGLAIGEFTNTPQKDFVERYYSIYAACGISTAMNIISSFNSAHIRQVLDDRSIYEQTESTFDTTHSSPSGTA